MTRLNQFFNELLLYSGQYALFYILMNFTYDGFHYFSNFGHTLLLVILILQTLFLIRFGDMPAFRFLGSLIAPLFYTILEIREGPEALLNTGHMFFWIFSFVTGSLQAIQIKTKSQQINLLLEFLVTTLNVLTFLFIYFYFDLKLYFAKQFTGKLITKSQYEHFLNIEHFFENLLEFLNDPAHIYIIMGGLILSTSLSIGRMKIIVLKDKINEIFGRYVDKDIRDKILTQPESSSERKEIAILFSDIRSFTSLSEHHDPDEITEMLNIYFSQWDQMVIKYNGIIDKYIGDAIMVLFGVQNKTEACDNAIKCALEMLDDLNELKKKLKIKGLPVFENIGVGINFGHVILGDIGSQQRKNYTAIGDNVNVAARLESLCKTLDSHLVVSQSTYEFLDKDLKERFEAHDSVALKGKSESMKVFAWKGKSISSDY